MIYQTKSEYPVSTDVLSLHQVYYTEPELLLGLDYYIQAEP